MCPGASGVTLKHYMYATTLHFLMFPYVSLTGCLPYCTCITVVEVWKYHGIEHQARVLMGGKGAAHFRAPCVLLALLHIVS